MDGARRRAGEGRVPGSQERRGLATPVAEPAVAVSRYPAATINVPSAGRAPTLSIPVQHLMTLLCSSLPFFP